MNSSPDLFLDTLWDIIESESALIKTQIPRLKRLWESHFINLGIKLPPIKEFIPNKNDFYYNNSNKAIILEQLEECMIEGYKIIKFIIDIIFNKYFKDSELFINTFNETDQLMVRYKTADKLVGSLLQFINEEKGLIDLEYIIISKYKSILKIKEISDINIMEKIVKDGYKCTLEQIHEIFNKLVSINLITKREQVNSNLNVTVLYKWNSNSDFTLTPQGDKIYKSYIMPIIEWAIEYWRSLYNIRTLNVKIPDNYKMKLEIENVLSRAATQGFSSAYFVIKNLKNYFLKI